MADGDVSKPTVLHVITGLGDGGAQSVLFRLCTHDQKTRHAVVCLGKEDRYADLLRKAGVETRCLRLHPAGLNLWVLWSLWVYIRSQRPNVVQTWMYHADLIGGLIALLAGHRNVIWGIRHTNLKAGLSSRRTILIAKLNSRLSRWLPRKIICCADQALSVHAKMGYDVQKMITIENGYDLSVFRPDRSVRRIVRDRLTIPEHELLIGFVARIDPQKDHGNLLRALAELKRKGKCPKCLLVGTDADETNRKLVNKIERLRLSENVRLLGPQEDISGIMNALDIHVMSSLFGEGFPNVVAEAMACGTPCVSTDVGDAKKIIGDTGLVVPANDPHALAGAIEGLFEEIGSRAWVNRCRDARNRVQERFSVGRMVQKYDEVWFENAD